MMGKKKISSSENKMKKSETNAFLNIFIKNREPLSLIEKCSVATKSAIKAISEPSNGSHISRLNEITGCGPSRSLLSLMKNSKEGREVLKTKPLINEDHIDLQFLRSLPEGTVGKDYTRFIDYHKFHPHERDPVRYMDDLDEAYIMTRYRQLHDFQHILWGLDVSVESEIALKIIEMHQTRYPMTAMASVFGQLAVPHVRLSDYHPMNNIPFYSNKILSGLTNSSPEIQAIRVIRAREFLEQDLIPWANDAAKSIKQSLYCIPIEKWFQKPTDDLRDYLGVKPLPSSILTEMGYL